MDQLKADSTSTTAGFGSKVIGWVCVGCFADGPIRSRFNFHDWRVGGIQGHWLGLCRMPYPWTNQKWIQPP